MDHWISKCNEQRPHSGQYCYGKTPMKTFREAEHLALEKAISTKQDVIRYLKEQFDSAPEEEWHLYSTPNGTKLNRHGQDLRKKLDWLKHLSDTRFKHWPAKGKEGGGPTGGGGKSGKAKKGKGGGKTKSK